MIEQQTPEEHTEEASEEQTPGDAWSKEVVVGEAGDVPAEPEAEPEPEVEHRRRK